MSFLAPLYLAGLAAISLPILFHLIRRTPQGRRAFSSLMFLSPSPPRVTRRSRLDNLLLLLLRGLALSLLALAFARPFLRQEADLNVSDMPGRRIALLVDTSASMRRSDLWQQASAQVQQVLADTSPADEVALFLFDRQVRSQMSFREWSELEPARRASVLAARLEETQPTWFATQLGEALAQVADALHDAGDEQADRKVLARQLVLITDLQQGSRVEALQGYEWPERVRLEVRTVAPRQATNAGLLALAERPEADPEALRDDRLRIRVSNAADSTREQFSLQWHDAAGPLPEVAAVPVYVPPGATRVVRVAWPANTETVDRLVLTGDDHSFDNTLYLVPPRATTRRIVYLGEDGADDAQGLLYYLQHALPQTRYQQLELVVRRQAEGVAPGDLLGASAVVADATAVAAGTQERLRSYLEQGGRLLLVLSPGGDLQSWSGLLPGDSWKLAESPAGNYALIGRVRFEHPVFAPFAEPRYADFTKIRFWKHRQVTLPQDSPATVLAWFDDGNPFLIEEQVGGGSLFVVTSGWRPADSQWALSTKFVPLVLRLLSPPHEPFGGPTHVVGDTLALPSPARDASRSVETPAGERIELAAATQSVSNLDQAGIYRLRANGETIPFAVNLSPEESQTEPLAAEELERRGAILGLQPTPQQWADRQRQLRIGELENRQKLWRWLIVGVLGILVVETTLAGHLAHRTSVPQVNS